MKPNSAFFKIYNRASKSFSVVLESFQNALTMATRIKIRHKIVFITRIKNQLKSIVQIKKIRVSGVMRLITSPIQTINLKKTSLGFIISEIIKAGSTVDIFQKISFNMGQKVQAFTTINVSKVSMSFSPILAKFFLLSDFDLQILGDLDPQTLGDMDYVES